MRHAKITENCTTQSLSGLKLLGLRMSSHRKCYLTLLEALISQLPDSAYTHTGPFPVLSVGTLPVYTARSTASEKTLPVTPTKEKSITDDFPSNFDDFDCLPRTPDSDVTQVTYTGAYAV